MADAEPAQRHGRQHRPPPARRPAVVGVEHRPDQRDGHVGVLPGAQARQGHRRRVGGLAVADRGDDLLLIGPDAEPHVEGHDRAEQGADVDVVAAEAPARPSAHQVDEAGDQQEGKHHGRLEILGAERLHDRVVDEDAEEGDGKHHEGGQGPILRGPGEERPAVVKDQHQQDHAGRPGPERAPAEPKQRARHQLRHHLLFGVAVHGGGEGSVDEIEEIQKADPQDPRDDVDPAEDRLENFD